MTPLLAVLVEVGVLGLFHPQRITIRPSGGTAVTVDGGTRVVLSGANSVGLRREGAQVDWFAHRTLHSAPEVKVRGAFLLRLDNGFQRRFHGEMRISSSASELRLLLKMESEDLVAAAVAAESPPHSPAAAREAQAILARSWILASRGRHGTFDFCDTTHCQHFKESSPQGREAALATRDLVITWQGNTFAPAYSASCGGKTFSAGEIGWDAADDYPYQAIDCPVCPRSEKDWSRTFSGDDAAAIREHPHSEAVRIRLNRRLGWDALPGNRYILEDLGARIIAKGRGLGHGLGYCQRGGAGLAREGASSSAILRHYFPGAIVKLVQ